MPSFGYSTDYEYLERALRDACIRFHSIEEYLLAFEPLPEEEARKKLREGYGKDIWTEEFIEEQVSFFSTPEAQFRHYAGTRFEVEYTTITILSSSLIEALINVSLQLLLSGIDRQDLFTQIDSVDLRTKWREGPKHVDPSYQFPSGTLLDQRLADLQRARNAIVHYKSEVSKDGIQVFEGISISHQREVSAIVWLKQIANLPYELLKMLSSHFWNYSIAGLQNRTLPFPNEAMVR